MPKAKPQFPPAEGVAYIRSVGFDYSADGIEATVDLVSNGCPDIEGGLRGRMYPLTLDIDKLSDIILKMKGKNHPKNWSKV